MKNGLEDGFLYWGVMAIVKSWPLHHGQDERGWTPMVCAEEAGESEVGLQQNRSSTWKSKDDWLGMRRKVKGHHGYFNIVEMPMDNPRKPKSRSHHQRDWEKSLQTVICQRVSLVVQLGSYILKLFTLQIKQYNFDSQPPVISQFAMENHHF